MAGSVSEARFAGLSLMQLHELLEDDAQLGDMVRGMEEVSALGSGEKGPGKARRQPEWGPEAGIEGRLGPQTGWRRGSEPGTGTWSLWGRGWARGRE